MIFSTDEQKRPTGLFRRLAILIILGLFFSFSLSLPAHFIFQAYAAGPTIDLAPTAPSTNALPLAQVAPHKQVSGLKTSPSVITFPPARPLASSGRVTDSLYVLYRFEEGGGSTVNDVSGVGSPMNLTIQDPANVTWITNALRINSGTIISSTAAATKIINNCQVSNEITLETWVQPANTTQDGPARIITVSDGAFDRNFTLAQEDDEYLVRLRTTTTNVNGQPEFYSGVGTLDTDLTHVVYTRDITGTEKFYIDNTLVATSTRTGNFSGWNTGYKLALINEYGAPRDWLGDYHLAAVYCRALTPSEVNQNYTAGTSQYEPMLFVDKDGPITAFRGDTVVFTYTVINLSSFSPVIFNFDSIGITAVGDGTPISNISVTDSITGVVPTYVYGDFPVNNQLDSNEAWVYTASYTILITDPNPLNSLATAQGIDLDGDTISATNFHQVSISVVPTDWVYLPLIIKR